MIGMTAVMRMMLMTGYDVDNGSGSGGGNDWW